MMTSVMNSLQIGALKILGDVKYHPLPPFFIYDPKGFSVKGYEIREVLKQVKPGDILLRGYDKHLSGLFIPGYFHHAALYVGPVEENALDRIEQDIAPNQRDHFGNGEQTVVHAMSQGVCMEDLIDFCRCDRLVILRFPETVNQRCDCEFDQAMIDNLSEEEEQLYLDLKAGKQFSFQEIFPLIFNTALKQVGKPYDFNFNFENYKDLSCTEYVQSCIKALAPFHGIQAVEKQYLGFFKKAVIEPDAFFRDCFEVVWQSESTDLNKMAPKTEPVKPGVPQMN